MNLVRLLKLVTVSLATMLPLSALADYGSPAISVLCHKKANTVEVRLFIFWNMELDEYLRQHPSGISADGPLHTTSFETPQRAYARRCRTPERLVKVSVARNGEPNSGTAAYRLVVVEDGKVVASKAIDYVWFAGGEQYILRSRRSKSWDECVGGDEGSALHLVECGAVTAARTTNSEEIDALRKR